MWAAECSVEATVEGTRKITIFVFIAVSIFCFFEACLTQELDFYLNLLL